MAEKEALLVQKAYEEIEKNKVLVENDPYRLNYHLMPPVGLLNDPNGLVQYKGSYHVFYQWNPFETAHGAKFWGHYSSRDMVHWREEPIALAPSEWYERNGCYSGSAVEWEGKLYLFYTGNVKLDDGTRETYQCVAVSGDGVHFEKKGPVLKLPEGYTAHFRDPKVWWKDGRWYMVIGAQTLNGKGATVLFSSDNLLSWTETGLIAGDGMNGLSDFGYMWECPDLIRLSGKDVLLVSPQGLDPSGHFYNNLFQSGYFVGQLDYETAQFMHGTFTELDRGFDFYAPQTFVDDKGRTILYGWMGITDENEPHQPTLANRWVHALTIPRELNLRGEKVYQRPIDELSMLRKNRIEYKDAELAGPATEFNGVKGKSVELLLDTMRVEFGGFRIRFRGEAELFYDSDKREISLIRKNFKSGEPERRTCEISGLSQLRIYMDNSSLEVFVNEGEEVFSARYFPKPENETIIFYGMGNFSLAKWDLEKMSIERYNFQRGAL
ncbi:sucrose-6-phosphate hydrolase [Neobacillus piezotolerans]|uniref:Sucrose-6-phosphate hydrolase n=1 Tax=Neobacillus piezotolerans TaxID=2259171 RepID=A0A3D8GSC0_9BACI|nr:sucrose-6-phosphate hydrolase [Neobacillus piezotolerans]RDU37355.1 sucrose-6-phosphate hydrolase [Neobacillus piezotolerans]